MHAARHLGTCWKGYRVYLLRDKTDQIGKLVAEDYDLSRILAAHQELKHCRVISYEDYYGIRIFLVRSKK